MACRRRTDVTPAGLDALLLVRVVLLLLLLLLVATPVQGDIMSSTGTGGAGDACRWALPEARRTSLSTGKARSDGSVGSMVCHLLVVLDAS